MKISLWGGFFSVLLLQGCASKPALPDYVGLNPKYSAQLQKVTVISVLPQKVIEGEFMSHLPQGQMVPMFPDGIIDPATGALIEQDKAQALSQVSTIALQQQQQHYNDPAYAHVSPAGQAAAAGVGAGVGSLLIEGINSSIVESGNKIYARRAQMNVRPLLKLGDLGEPGALASALQVEMPKVSWLKTASVTQLSAPPSDAQMEAYLQDGSVLVIYTHYAVSPDMRSLVLESYVTLYDEKLGMQNYHSAIPESHSDVTWAEAPLYRNVFRLTSPPLSVPPKTDADREALARDAKTQYDVNKAETTAEYTDLYNDQYHASYDAKKPEWTDFEYGYAMSPAWSADDGAELKKMLLMENDMIAKMISKDLVSAPSSATTADAAFGH